MPLRRLVIRSYYYTNFIKGSIFDVVVDLRIQSKTFGKWSSAILSQLNHNELWVPEGFAHGFLVLSDYAIVIYKTDNFYNQKTEGRT